MYDSYGDSSLMDMLLLSMSWSSEAIFLSSFSFLFSLWFLSYHPQRFIGVDIICIALFICDVSIPNFCDIIYSCNISIVFVIFFDVDLWIIVFFYYIAVVVSEYNFFVFFTHRFKLVDGDGTWAGMCNIVQLFLITHLPVYKQEVLATLGIDHGV